MYHAIRKVLDSDGVVKGLIVKFNGGNKFIPKALFNHYSYDNIG